MFILLASLALPSGAQAADAAATDTAAAGAPAERAEDTWDLSHVYPSVEAWEAEMTRVEAEVDALGGCEGVLAKRLRGCLDQRATVSKAVGRLHTYASNHSSADTRDDAWRARAQRAEILWTRLAERSAFFEPEIVAIGAAKIERALKRDPGLAPHAYFLRSTLRDAAHTLDAPREALLAATGTVRETPARLHGVLVNADLPWPTIQVDGEPARLDPSGYAQHRSSSDREVRKAVYDAFYGALAGFEDTLGTSLDGAVQGHWLVARTRGYDSSMAASLDGDHVPAAVYTTLVESTRRNLPTLHRYLKLRARLLDVTDLAYHDMYPPLVALDRTWTVDEAEALTLASARPVGAPYTEVLERGFAGRWTDVYPRPGKRAGAYMDDGAYDVHPYLLLNYTGDYESVATFAHEWGHAVHSSLATAAQPYPTANYSTFLAEIASTFGEALLLDHVWKTAKDDDERLFYLGSALEGLRGTYFRQAQFAEFELAVHTQVERGEPLTGAGLSATYLDILRRYYGHDAGVTRIDDAYAVEWAYIPHFYYDFYVYQYATSIAAASLLAEDVLAGKPGAVDRYLGLLRAGGSDDPYPLLRAAGVDLASPAPYDSLARRMDAIMDEIEAILARRERAEPAKP